MRRFDWGFGIRRPRAGFFRHAVLALLTLISVVGIMASADPAQANRKYAAIVIDGKSGEVLFSRKADYRRYPASLTKVMTLYMLFEALEGGKVKLTDKIPVSKRCSGMPPSKLGVRAGEKIAVEHAIEALIVRSANDVACTVGEKLGGSEYKFGLAMTKKAKSIGMKRTTFRNASGLYNRAQVTTARDMATLALRIQKDYPQYYHYFKRMKVSWKGRTWSTHNRLMKYFPGADGLKTGYINASGFNLITSARRGNMHLVGVVMGGRKSRTRDAHMVTLLETNFARLLKRPSYVYPIADRLPTIRPKPDFQRIAAAEWLGKKAGVMPRPNPFAPKEPAAAAVIADLSKTAPASTAGKQEDKGAKIQGKGGPEAAPEEPQSAPAEPARRAETTNPEAGQSEMPVLAASGSGTLPAGETRLEPAPSGTTESSAPADASPEDTIARLIEADHSQPEDSTSITESDEVKLASAGPAGTHMAQALRTPARRWGVQVGAFTSVELAEVHLDNAERLQPGILTREKSALVPGDKTGGEIYRARFGPMDESEAKQACEALKVAGMHCFAVEADDWSRAVRR